MGRPTLVRGALNFSLVSRLLLGAMGLHGG